MFVATIAPLSCYESMIHDCVAPHQMLLKVVRRNRAVVIAEGQRFELGVSPLPNQPKYNCTAHHVHILTTRRMHL